MLDESMYCLGCLANLEETKQGLQVEGIRSLSIPLGKMDPRTNSKMHQETIQTTKLGGYSSYLFQKWFHSFRLSLICDTCASHEPHEDYCVCACTYIVNSLTFESNNSHQKTINNLGQSGMFCALQHVLKPRLSNCVTCVPLQPQTNLPECNLFTLLNSPISLVVLSNYISQKKQRRSQNSHADNFSRLKEILSESFTDLWSILQYWCSKITIKKHHKICKYTIKKHTFTLWVFYFRQHITNLTSEMAS